MPQLLIEVLHGATPANDILAADCVVAFITAVFNDRGSKRLSGSQWRRGRARRSATTAYRVGWREAPTTVSTNSAT
jgi:hypothetical protein